jgi:hypothetical protein
MGRHRRYPVVRCKTPAYAINRRPAGQAPGEPPFRVKNPCQLRPYRPALRQAERTMAALDALLGMALEAAFLMRNRNIRIRRIRASRPAIAFASRGVARRTLSAVGSNPDCRSPRRASGMAEAGTGGLRAPGSVRTYGRYLTHSVSFASPQVTSYGAGRPGRRGGQAGPRFTVTRRSDAAMAAAAAPGSDALVRGRALSRRSAPAR